MRRSVLSGIAAGCCILSWTGSGAALDAKVKIDPKTGTIEVKAKGVAGPLMWGNTPNSVTNSFDDPNCVSGGSASGCHLGPPQSKLATTPPEGCVLYVSDGGPPVPVLIKKCTPGLRPPVELPSRFVDNGDGTITDTKTALMWEKKTGTLQAFVFCTDVPCPDPTEVENLYLWDGVNNDFLERVNGKVCETTVCDPLAGHTDWRLPTIQELQKIVDPSRPGCDGSDLLTACINPIFGPTAPVWYWTSSRDDIGVGTNLWAVSFFTDGQTVPQTEDTPAYARAVRNTR